MKKKLSQINKDLDLRRFGKNVYSKAMSEGGKESGEGGNSGNDMDFINLTQANEQIDWKASQIVKL